MSSVRSVNDIVVRFANVNGTGSASANGMFSKAIFRMGIPVSPKNIFPSNIQGLPTWYEVRISEKGYLGRREEIDLLVGVNPQSMTKDIAELRSGGYFVYDNTRPLPPSMMREDIHFIGIPMMQLAMDHFDQARQQQLLKNMIYIGALVALLEMDMEVIHTLIREQFGKKEALVKLNFQAVDLGFTYASQLPVCPLPMRVERRDLIGDRILIEGNTATALGAIYGGATVVAWYPITPSTSVVEAFAGYAKKLRIDPSTGEKNYAIVQAEDELAAMGMVIGAMWNGARAFTATSGPGVSLMSEFLGLAFFAEIPAVLVDVQRGGPSTGMPTRTQQSDITLAAYASHGDTKHMLLFPSTPAECFEMTAQAFDFADRFQTPIIVMSDLDLGMNDHLSPPLAWDDTRRYDRGKVLSAEELEALPDWGRYRDVDGDGIGYRTLPGTHPTKGAFFTRGSSHDEYARYTEDGKVHARVLDRMARKWETAKSVLPKPELYQATHRSELGLVFFGTSAYAAAEAMDLLVAEDLVIDSMRIRSFPFSEEVAEFIMAHERIFVVEQNREAQLRSLLINELEIDPKKLIKSLHYDGMPITADAILRSVQQHLADLSLGLSSPHSPMNFSRSRP